MSSKEVIFQSETLVKQFLVSGLMSMTRIQPNGNPMLNEQVWPKFFSKPCNELVKSDFRDNSDFTFFVSGKAQGHFLSDSPAWADISDRLSDTSAVDRIAGLLLDDQKERGETEFYYYTFKKDVNDLQNVIERNLVRFYAYGKVTVLASEGIEYSGKAYFMKSTLRLSLVNQLGGFLEVFLKLNGDKSSMQRPDILYGASLWHSDDRIQAKTVVLSRSGVSKFDPKANFFWI
ncbi:hypothetical protein [Dyadobacter sp. 3J3]|uniref:hypothetical protein n=1 Tax=Dyadobacter sp. 3J3 TaxID=2606600 RepID=UPI0013581731|nr:hypothetical protein [Dyadobacter sp. 3J3]